MSACSINTTWERNQECVAEYYQTGKVAHMSKVQAMVDTISECPCPVGLLPLFGGLKTRSFYLNLLNPTPTTKTPPVTIDRWMLRWLTGDDKKPTPKQYGVAIQAIYRVAEERKLSPIEAQAVIWTELRGTHER